MLKKWYLEIAPDPLEPVGDQDIRAARRRISGRMIVRENDCSSTQFLPALEQVKGIGLGTRHRSDRHELRLYESNSRVDK